MKIKTRICSVILLILVLVLTLGFSSCKPTVKPDPDDPIVPPDDPVTPIIETDTLNITESGSYTINSKYVQINISAPNVTLTSGNVPFINITSGSVTLNSVTSARVVLKDNVHLIIYENSNVTKVEVDGNNSSIELSHNLEELLVVESVSNTSIKLNEANIGLVGLASKATFTGNGQILTVVTDNFSYYDSKLPVDYIAYQTPPYVSSGGSRNINGREKPVVQTYTPEVHTHNYVLDAETGYISCSGCTDTITTPYIAFLGENNELLTQNIYFLSGSLPSGVTYNSSTNSLTYTNTGAARNVVIRTNSSATELNVNAPVDTVRHFGVAGVVDITSIAATSYHENGTVSLVKIKNGRIVVTEEAEIAGVHVVATEGNYDGIKVAVVGNAQLPSFTRDDVALEADQSKLVIEVQTLTQETTEPTTDNTQYVWITGVGENVVSSSVSSSITSATVAVTTESDVAQAVKTEARESTSAAELEQLEEAATRYAGGIGTEAKPYLIKTEEHFNSLNEDVNNLATTGVYYKLTSDLSFDDFGMIGSVLYTSHGEQSGEVESITSFNGHLDGNNHSITYSITKPATIASSILNNGAGGVGLFGCIEEATVKDLVINANINWTNSGYVGGLAGVLCNCQVTNVTVNGTIRGYKAVGGFAGFGYTFNYDNPTSFTNCVNNAQIIASYDTTSSNDQYVVAGGFIGEGSVYNYNGSWGGSLDNRMTFDNCSNNGSFKFLGTSEKSIACFGNFIGFSSDSYYGSFYFNNCSASADVSYEGTLATQRTVSNKTILTGYSTTNVALAPTIKYIGITSNVWGGTTAKNAIYVDDVLVEGSTGDHIQVNE